MRKLRTYLGLPWPRWALLLEAGVLLAAAALAVAVVPFRYLAAHLGTPMRESGGPGEGQDPPAVRAVSWAVQVAARNLPWAPTCLARAVAAKLMLRRRGIPSTLYLGVAHEGSAIRAHAWLRSGKAILTGAEANRGFTAVCWFS